MRDEVNGRFVRKSEQEVKRILESKYPKFTYVGGYKSIDDLFVIKCNDCGSVFKRNADILRPSRKKQIQCKQCNHSNKLKKEIELKMLREKEKLDKQRKKKINAKNKTINKECIECGEVFKTNRKNQMCCNKECSKKHQNRNKDKRIYKNGNPDNTITLTKLIKRDNNICYLCGCVCDNNDFYLLKDGTFIAGNNYPSIDHVTPIAKGGKHVWDNVKLAHRHCNTLKRDNITVPL